MSSFGGANWTGCFGANLSFGFSPVLSAIVKLDEMRVSGKVNWMDA
jgi:hypothetical protein